MLGTFEVIVSELEMGPGTEPMPSHHFKSVLSSANQIVGQVS
jgi:hypothetical protein